MSMLRCPGQDKRTWGPEAIFETECRECGAMVEFFKDEPKRKCPECGTRVFNPEMDLGCAEWCPAAEECLKGNALELTDDQRGAIKKAVTSE